MLSYFSPWTISPAQSLPTISSSLQWNHSTDTALLRVMDDWLSSCNMDHISLLSMVDLSDTQPWHPPPAPSCYCWSLWDYSGLSELIPVLPEWSHPSCVLADYMFPERLLSWVSFIHSVHPLAPQFFINALCSCLSWCLPVGACVSCIARVSVRFYFFIELPSTWGMYSPNSIAIIISR